MNPPKAFPREPVGMVETDNYIENDVTARYEAHDEHKDLVGGEPEQDPTKLLAHAGDHTPNFKGAAKPDYGKHTGRDAEGLYHG